MEYTKLSNGFQMPKIGLGTDDVLFVRKLMTSTNKYINKGLDLYHRDILKPYLNLKLSNSIAYAIKNGYRLIDTSSAYDNEKAIGRAIIKSGIPRKDLFITSRCTNKDQYNHCVRDSFFRSLHNFGLEYIDLYMFHWPVTDYFLDTWHEMEKLQKEGYIRSLGVANCHKHHLEEIINNCDIKPVVNQIEIHPLFTQKDLIAYCISQNIQVEAYSPIAQNNDRICCNKVLNACAIKYGKSMQQIILRWHIQNGIIPIPRSTNRNRLCKNIDIFDFSLTDDEMKHIDAININSRLRYDPDNCDFTQL